MTILSDAYNLLKDPGRRESYLRYGAGWSHGHAGPSRRASRPPPYGRPSGFAHSSGPFPTWGYGPFHEPFGAGPRPHPTWAYQHHAQWSQPGSTGYAAWSYARSGSHEAGQGTTTASANATGPRAGQVSTSLTIGAGLFVVLWSALSATNSYRASVPMPLAGADMGDRRAFAAAPPDPIRSPTSAPTSWPASHRPIDGAIASSWSRSGPSSPSESAASSSSPSPPSPRLPPPLAPRPDREPPPQLVATPPPPPARSSGSLLAPGTSNRHEEARDALARARSGRDVHGARRRELLDRQLRRLEIDDIESGRRGTGHVEPLSLPPPRPSAAL